MFSWEQRKLGEIGKWYKGIGGTKDDLNTKQSGRMFVHYADLYQTSEFLSNVVHWTINEIIGALIAPNSILFPMSDVTPYGLARTTSCKLKDVRAGGDVLINTIDTNIDSDFVSIYINLFSKNILPFVTGTTVKHINSKSLSELTILIPSFEEQVKIVNLVKFYNEIITLHQCKFEKLKLTKKALLQKLFPKNGKHIPEIRFKGFTDAWEQRKLGEFVKIISGDAPSTFISGRCIYVKVDDLNYSDRIQLSSSNLVNINPKAHLVNKGATIFPKRGAAIMTNKVRIMGKDGYLDTNMMALIPEEIDKDFLFTFIQKTGLYKIADTSTIPQINNKHIEPYMIQVPNDKEQECIGVVFEKIDKIITLHQQEPFLCGNSINGGVKLC